MAKREELSGGERRHSHRETTDNRPHRLPSPTFASEVRAIGWSLETCSRRRFA